MATSIKKIMGIAQASVNRIDRLTGVLHQQIAGMPLISDASLKAYWEFKAGAQLADSSGNGRNLVKVGTINEVVGLMGGGGDLGNPNGGNYFDPSGNHGVNGNADLSVSMWLNWYALVSDGKVSVFFEHYSTGGLDRYVQMWLSRSGATYTLTASSSGSNASYNVTPATGTPHHIVMTRNYSGNSIHLWLNGSDVANNVLGTGTASYNGIRLGSSGNSSEHTKAIVYNTAVFGKVLSSAEIGAIYGAGLKKLMGVSNV